MSTDERRATAVEDDRDAEAAGDRAADEDARDVEQPDASEDREEEAPDTAELDERVEELEAEVDRLTDKLARSRAELQNTLKERSRDVSEAETRGKVTLLKVLGELTDDLDRAIDAAEEQPAILTGLELVKRRIEAAFETHDVEIDDPLGEQFDPRRHEAVIREETDEAEEGTIVEVLQTGLLIGERVVRPALVKVATKPSGD